MEVRGLKWKEESIFLKYHCPKSKADIFHLLPHLTFKLTYKEVIYFSLFIYTEANFKAIFITATG